MYLRDTDFPTLAEVHTELRDRRQTWSGSSTDVSILVHEPEDRPSQAAIDLLEGEERKEADGAQRVGTARFGDNEVPLTRNGMGVLAQFYDIPVRFLERVTPEEQQFILASRIQRTEDRPLVLKFAEREGIGEAYLATQQRLDLAFLTSELMGSVMPEDAKVVEWWNNADEFRLDVIVPEDFHRGIGGDRQVGDLTHGGLRIGQNRKQNLAPWVQPYMFRLACTNGMEVPDVGLKVEARGVDATDLAFMLIAEANRAFDRVMDDIKHFYDMRDVPVSDDRTGLFRRIAQEQGISERMIGRMEDTLPTVLESSDSVSMFDLLNHMTNEANDPAIRRQVGVRRSLERAGGGLIHEHAQRCPSCQTKLSH